MSINENLPIFKYKKQILDKISENQVIIITGSTGCGKSTQVPQYIIDNFKNSRVICTCPTRICTVSLARYVSKIRDGQGRVRRGRGRCGESVGYQIGGQSEITDKTVIEYQTTGILKEVLLNWSVDSERKYASHIIIDEIHDRNVDIDSCLYLIKRVLLKVKFKVILMSATIDPGKFVKYFEGYGSDNDDGESRSIPVIHIPDRRFVVKEVYLDDCFKWIKLNNMEINKMIKSFVIEKPKLFSFVEIIITRLIQNIHVNESFEKSILVFLPGISEIFQFEKTLKTNLNIQEYDIFFLHSIIRIDDQSGLFKDIKKRKIILSTNIAESSITIPDIHYIFDFCLFKEMNLNFHNGAEELKLNWCSRESLMQRSGRTGRVQRGICFRMIPKTFFEQLQRDITPELLRVSLTHLILKLMKMSLKEKPETVLKKFLDPPNLANIKKAYSDLEESNAIISNNSKKIITDFGYFAASMPLNLYSSYLMFLGFKFGYFHECILLSSILDVGGIFYHSYRSPLSSLRSMHEFANDKNSDVFACYFAMIKFYIRKEGGSNLNKNDYCFQNNIHLRRFHEVEVKVKIIYEKLRRMKNLIHYNESKKLPLHLMRCDDESLFSMRILIGCSFRSFLVKCLSEKKIGIPFKEFPTDRTAVLKLKHKIMDSNEEEKEKIRQFVEEYDGGFGKVVKMKFSKKMAYVEFKRESVEKDRLYTPLNLITKIGERDFKTFRHVNTELQAIPYTAAYSDTRLQFESLFFPNRITVGRRSIMRIFSNPSFGPNRQYNFVFGSCNIGGDHIWVDNSTLLPDFKGLNDIIFLVFCSKIKRADINLRYLEIIQNQSLYYFSPIITDKIVDMVNDLRKYLSKSLSKNVNLNRKYEYLNKLKELIRLNDSLHNQLNNNNPDEKNNSKMVNDTTKLKNLFFIKDQLKIEVKILQKVSKNVFQYFPLDQNLSLKQKYSIILIMKSKYNYVTSNFYPIIEEIEKGSIVTFGLDNEFNMKVEVISEKRDSAVSINRVYMQRKNKKMKINFLLGKQFQKIQRMYNYVDFTEKKNQIILRHKPDMVVIPISVFDNEIMVLCKKGKEFVTFEHSNRLLSVEMNTVKFLAKYIYRFCFNTNQKESEEMLLKFMKKFPLDIIRGDNYFIVFAFVPYADTKQISHLFDWGNLEVFKKINKKSPFSIIHMFFEDLLKIGNDYFIKYYRDPDFSESVIDVEKCSQKIVSHKVDFLDNDNNVFRYRIQFVNDQWVFQNNRKGISLFELKKILHDIIYTESKRNTNNVVKLFIIKYDKDEYFVNALLNEIVQEYSNVSFSYSKKFAFYEIELVIKKVKIIDSAKQLINEYLGTESLYELNMVFFTVIKNEILRYQEIFIKIDNKKDNVTFAHPKGNLYLSFDDFCRFVRKLGKYLLEEKINIFRFYISTRKNILYELISKTLNQLGYKNLLILKGKTSVNVLQTYDDITLHVRDEGNDEDENSIFLNNRNEKYSLVEKYITSYVEHLSKHCNKECVIKVIGENEINLIKRIFVKLISTVEIELNVTEDKTEVHIEKKIVKRDVSRIGAKSSEYLINASEIRCYFITIINGKVRILKKDDEKFYYTFTNTVENSIESLANELSTLFSKDKTNILNFIVECEQIECFFNGGIMSFIIPIPKSIRNIFDENKWSIIMLQDGFVQKKLKHYSVRNIYKKFPIYRKFINGFQL